ncbi:hypothetical protein [Pseudodesulfovibrio sp.]|uniref:hypothetical protein n=1 Tax=Pseudodesulfovibrio sp. TaxID=2035812 RepID=UPI0026191270|nr:hypothetical protein [Pseudodesulfovibrio sp.]MDD3310613.1 hypothetical protein [Pseudodesulfovibrio sp.]
MDNSTIYLILALSGFVFVVVLMIHQHNCSDMARRKRGKVEAVTRKLQPRIEILEKEIVDLKVKIEEIDEQIVTFQ